MSGMICGELVKQMKKISFVYGMVVALAAFFLEGASVQGQNSYCVRAGATGNGNGSDWSNAYPSLPATLQRGAIYFIATGTYGSYRFDDAASGTNLITIKRATATDHKTDVGWSPAFGVGQAVWNGPLHFDTSYWIFDGQTRNDGDWFSAVDYGFKIFHNNNEQQIRMGVLGTAVSYIQIRNTYLQAPNTGLSTSVTGRRYGLDIDTFGGAGTSFGLVVSKCFFQYGNVPIFTHDNDGMILEYTAFDANESNDANHGEAMSAYYSNHRFKIRYNKFRAIQGTAVIAFTTASTQYTDGFEIYGNVVWNCTVGDGVFGFDRVEWPFSNTKIYNNTIVDKVGGFNHGIAINSGINNWVYNNLWINCSSSFWNGSGATYTNNAYSWSRSEPGAQINLPTSVFVNYTGKDFRLASPTAVGSPLVSPYNKDLLGNTRGADGVWDRGAYEYTGIADSTPPVISNPGSSSVASTSALIAWSTDEASSTIVEFGTTLAYGISASNTAPVQSHSITLVNLTPSTLYNYRVSSSDLSGNLSTSGNLTFQTSVADNTSPTVALTGLVNGMTVSNTVNFTATASDNIGVVGVRFFVDGGEVYDDGTSPYAFAWDSSWTTNGVHRVFAQARDASGNISWTATNNLAVANPIGVLPSSSVYWDFSEGTGSVTLDTNSNARLAFRNGATWGVGKSGYGLVLDGISGRADATNNSRLDYDGNAVTVAAWVKLDNLNSWQQLVAKVSDVGVFSPPYFCWHLYAGTLSATQWIPQFQLANSSQSSVFVSSAAVVNYGEWVHLAGVYDGALVRIYVNGIERGSAAQNGNILRANQPLYVGAHGLPGEFAKGTMDEIYIFSGALTAAQIQTLYGGVRPAPPTGFRIVSSSEN